MPRLSHIYAHTIQQSGIEIPCHFFGVFFHFLIFLFRASIFFFSLSLIGIIFAKVYVLYEYFKIFLFFIFSPLLVANLFGGTGHLSLFSVNSFFIYFRVGILAKNFLFLFVFYRVFGGQRRLK